MNSKKKLINWSINKQQMRITSNNWNSTPNQKLLQEISKNVNTVSVKNRGQQENNDLITVINFVEQIITILSKYSEQ